MIFINSSDFFVEYYFQYKKLKNVYNNKQIIKEIFCKILMIILYNLKSTWQLCKVR